LAAPPDFRSPIRTARGRGEWVKLEAAADSDKDGRVGVEEYLSYYAGMNDLSEVTHKTAGMILAMLDRDRDGKVSQAEYVASAPPGVPETAQAALFARLDRDRDGYLTNQEVLQAVQEFMLGEDPGAPGNDLLGPLG
jgi:Ca2+-binding EF-hand superfamily protein